LVTTVVASTDTASAAANTAAAMTRSKRARRTPTLKLMASTAATLSTGSRQANSIVSLRRAAARRVSRARQRAGKCAFHQGAPDCSYFCARADWEDLDEPRTGRAAFARVAGFFVFDGVFLAMPFLPPP
jgi:hypothetical protein